jgi:hypothetical protein
MENAICKLYGQITAGSADAVAALDVQSPGFISSIFLDMVADLGVTGAWGRMEISFASASGFTNNDTRNSLAGLESFLSQSSAVGVVNNQRSIAIPGLKIVVAQGERIFMHLASSGSFTVRGRAWLYVQSESYDRALARRR